MQNQLFYKDSAGAFDQTKVKELPLNQGLILRQKLAKNSQLVDMCGPIFADTFNMSRYLLNEVDVRLKLFQSKHDFRLMSSVAGKKYKVIITEVMLKEAMVGIHPDIFKSHVHALKDTPAIYPFNRTDVKTSVPAKALQPKFSSNTYIEAYQTLFSGMNIDGKDAGIVCSRNDYPKGYTLVVFDLSSEVVDASVQTVQKQGNLQLEVRFAEALPEAINVILYASFPGEISIDQARTIRLT